MMKQVEDHTASLDLATRVIDHDFLVWHKALRELKEHNERLARIICELLIKNQQLRTASMRSVTQDELAASRKASREAA